MRWANAALAALVVLACAACAGGGSDDADGGTDKAELASATAVASARYLTGAPALADGSYRWLVRTTGPPPTIAQENRARGTTSWRLPGSSEEIGGEAHGTIAGYVSAQSATAGETERIYVDAQGARTVTIEIFRMGWYAGSGGRLVLETGKLTLRRQPPCTHSTWTGLTECRWRPTLAVELPSALASGVYIAKLTASTGAQSDCMFVLRAARAPALLVNIPTATYEAYNGWGGDSLYPGGDRVGATGTSQGVEVSYDRPYATRTGAGQFFIREVAVVRFLERYGYPVGYTSLDSLDSDPGQLAGVRAVLDAGHSEYWSTTDERALAGALARGTSLVFLSSDTMAWRVRFMPATRASSEAGAPAHTIVAYKEYAVRDPDRAAPTGLFPRGGAPLVGSAYDGCITPRVKQLGPPVYRYYPWRPSPALQPSWLFAHTGITARTVIGGIVGYELDERTYGAPIDTVVVGESSGTQCGYGHEPAPVYGALAQTTLYSTPKRAIVFATGALGWIYALSPVAQASPDAPRKPDPRVVAMTRNVLAMALSRR